MTLGAVLLAAIGFVNLIIGYLIRYRRQYDLIAGVDIRRIANPERVARWAGRCGLALGVECVVASACLMIWPGATLTMPLFATAVIVTVGLLVLGTRT